MEAKYSIYKIPYKTAYEDQLTSIIATDSMSKARFMLETYLKSINTPGFEARFVIDTGFRADREGIILYR